MSFLKFSDYYDHSLSLQLYIFLISIFVMNYCFSLFDRKIISTGQLYNLQDHPNFKRSQLLDIFVLIYFCVDCWYVGTLPIIELLNLRNYKEIDHLFGYSLLILPLSMARVMILFETRKFKLDLLWILFYFLFFLINVSRIIIFIMTIVLIVSYIESSPKKRKINFSKFLNVKVIGIITVILFAFGLMGEFKSSSSSNFETAEKNEMTVIRYLSMPNDSFDRLNINDNFMWPYIYAVSTLYNLNSAIESNNSKNTDILVKSVTPNFVYQNFLNIEKDKSFLVVDTFNTSTVYGELIHGFGIYVGLIYHFLLCIFLLCCSVLVQKSRSKILSTFLTVFVILTIFSGVILKEIFLVTLIFYCLIRFFQKTKFRYRLDESNLPKKGY